MHSRSVFTPPVRNLYTAPNCPRGRRKYSFPAQLDERIREIYLADPRVKARPDIRHLAKQVGIPHWAIKKRARELGLARTKQKPWSEAEPGLENRGICSVDYAFPKTCGS